MTRYQLSGGSIDRHERGHWVTYTDAEAYAEEKAREAVKYYQEQTRDTMKMAEEDAVEREREEILAEFDRMADRDGADHTKNTFWGSAAAFIRSRGAGLKCTCGAVHGQWHSVGCAIYDRKPAPKLEKLEHLSESEFDGDKFWVVKKLNAAIDAIEALRRERG